MLTGFSLVFCIVLGLLFLFFALIWNSRNLTNILIKTTNFVGVFMSVYMALRCTHLHPLYLGAVSIWSLIGGMMWRTDSPLNITLKAIVVASALLSACLILIR